jgi:hypothetical protein
MAISEEEREAFLKTGILPQYAYLKSLEQAMPVIRKILGIPEHGKMPENFIGRTMQKFIDTNSKETLRESGDDKPETFE